MGSHPINLFIRFLLEIAALIAVGIWGWRQSEGWFRLVLAIGIPLIFATLWGTFAVPNDPSRSGSAPVVTPGVIRLLLELVFFGCAVGALYQIGLYKVSMVMGILVVLHYAFSYDRVMWLLSN